MMPVKSVTSLEIVARDYHDNVVPGWAVGKGRERPEPRQHDRECIVFRSGGAGLSNSTTSGVRDHAQHFRQNKPIGEIRTEHSDPPIRPEEHINRGTAVPGLGPAGLLTGPGPDR